MRRLRVLLLLAWRNLWRNHRRTLIMLGAISIGVWAMIFMTALSQGMVTQMIDDGIAALPGHVQVHHRDFLDDPNIDNAIPVPDAELEAALGGAGFRGWATRVRVPAMIMSERETRAVTLLGIDPERERGLTFLDRADIDGRFLESAADDGIVIGRELLDKLDTDLGKRVVVMSQDPDNEIADRGFRVVGVFEANVERHEERFAFAGKQSIQAMLGAGDRVTEAVVLGDDYRNVQPLLERVRAAVDDGLAVEPWKSLDPYLGAMLDVMDGFVLVWVIVIFLALSFGLVNTLVMAVFERVREIGLMLALGMKPSSIVGQILIESMLLLGIGLVIGNAAAILTIRPLESGIDLSAVAEGMEMMGAASVIYPDLRLHDMVLANAVVLVLGFLASLSPAWRASRYQPVEAITRSD
jgi:ABC-type lipoprotein release transport system permease subunit